jgi:hypothetical protein
MPADEREDTNPDLSGLTGRIEALESALQHLGREVVTRKVVVLDPDSRTELVAEVVDGVLELRVGLVSEEPGRRTELLCFAAPARDELPGGVGVQLWANGDVANESCWWDDDG